MAASTRKYYVTVSGDYLLALDSETAQLLGRNRDWNELHAYVQNLFPGSVYTPLDEERVRQYIAGQRASSNGRLPSLTTSISQPNQQPFSAVIPGNTHLQSMATEPFSTTLPDVLAAIGGLLFLLLFAAPIKSFSIFGVIISHSPNGYHLLQGGYGAFAVAIMALMANKIIQRIRGKHLQGKDLFFANYVTIALLTIALVLALYVSVHLYDPATGQQLVGIGETPNAGTLYSIPALLIVLAGGIIEVRRSQRAEAEVRLRTPSATRTLAPSGGMPVPNRVVATPYQTITVSGRQYRVKSDGAKLFDTANLSTAKVIGRLPAHGIISVTGENRQTRNAFLLASYLHNGTLIRGWVLEDDVIVGV